MINSVKIFLIFVLLLASITKRAQAIQDVTIIAVGDIMLGTDFPRDRLPIMDGKLLLKNVKDILKDSDITFGNYEGVLLDGGKPKKICKDTTKCYLFRTPVKYAYNLVDAGFDVISLANNHINDFGKPGLYSSRHVLDSYNLLHTGFIDEAAIVSINDISCAFIGFATSPNCNSLLDIEKAKQIISEYKKKNDLVIVSFHGGAEGVDAMHIKYGMELFYEEERGEVIQFSHSVIDAGADLVIGHGPHVPRAMELYKGKLIAYSLGNFCTYKGFSISGVKGAAPILKVKLNQKGTLISGKIISAKQKRTTGTYLDSTNFAGKIIRDLSNIDFPNSGIRIKSSGEIIQKKPLLSKGPFYNTPESKKLLNFVELEPK